MANTKPRHKRPTITHSNTTPAAQLEKTRVVWLAALGAVSFAQKLGGNVLARMAWEGENFQLRTQKSAGKFSADAKEQIAGVIVPLRANAKRGAKILGTVVQRGVADALSRLGIPSKSDIEHLSQRVAALSRQLKTAK